MLHLQTKKNVEPSLREETLLAHSQVATDTSFALYKFVDCSIDPMLYKRIYFCVY
jgi:hypothetical protein